MKGDLAYYIFDREINSFAFNYNHNHTYEISLNCLERLTRVQEYFEIVKEHVLYCHNLSLKHGFALLNNNLENLSEKGVLSARDFLNFGIGGHFNSFERFEKFIYMIIEERKNIIDSRSDIIVASNNIKK